MDYCVIEYTDRIPFECLYNYLLLYQLGEDHQWGDIIKVNDIKHILLSTFNNLVYEMPNDKDYYPTTGMYVNLVPLHFVRVLASNKSLKIEGYLESINSVDFYKCNGFDENLIEQLGDYAHTTTTYYYIKQ